MSSFVLSRSVNRRMHRLQFKCDLCIRLFTEPKKQRRRTFFSPIPNEFI